MKRMLFVYNPNSGMGLLKPKLSDVIDTFVKGGYEVTVYPTQRSQDAVRKVSEYTEEYDLVTCSGGDGTLDEVVTGMMMRENKTRSDIFRPERRMILQVVCIFPRICWRPQIQL